MKKSVKVKNPCRVCLKQVHKKDGLRCNGACKRWSHYKCLQYSREKIKGIKDGLIIIECPCPDCDDKIVDNVNDRKPKADYVCRRSLCPRKRNDKVQNIPSQPNKNTCTQTQIDSLDCCIDCPSFYDEKNNQTTQRPAPKQSFSPASSKCRIPASTASCTSPKPCAVSTSKPCPASATKTCPAATIKPCPAALAAPCSPAPKSSCTPRSCTPPSYCPSPILPSTPSSLPSTPPTFNYTRNPFQFTRCASTQCSPPYKRSSSACSQRTCTQYTSPCRVPSLQRTCTQYTSPITFPVSQRTITRYTSPSKAPISDSKSKSPVTPPTPESTPESTPKSAVTPLTSTSIKETPKYTEDQTKTSTPVTKQPSSGYENSLNDNPDEPDDQSSDTSCSPPCQFESPCCMGKCHDDQVSSQTLEEDSSLLDKPIKVKVSYHPKANALTEENKVKRKDPELKIKIIPKPNKKTRLFMERSSGGEVNGSSSCVDFTSYSSGSYCRECVSAFEISSPSEARKVMLEAVEQITCTIGQFSKQFKCIMCKMLKALDKY